MSDNQLLSFPHPRQMLQEYIRYWEKLQDRKQWLELIDFPTVHLLIVIQQYCVFPVIGIWMLNDVVVKLSNSVEL